MERRISGLVRGGGPGVDWRLPSSGGRGAGPSGLDGVRAVEQRLQIFLILRQLRDLLISNRFS